MKREEFNQKIAGLVTREEFQPQLDALRAEMHQKFGKLRAEINPQFQTLIWKNFGLNFAFFSAAVALLKYAP